MVPTVPRLCEDDTPSRTEPVLRLEVPSDPRLLVPTALLRLLETLRPVLNDEVERLLELLRLGLLSELLRLELLNELPRLMLPPLMERLLEGDEERLLPIEELWLRPAPPPPPPLWANAGVKLRAKPTITSAITFEVFISLLLSFICLFLYFRINTFFCSFSDAKVQPFPEGISETFPYFSYSIISYLLSVYL